MLCVHVCICVLLYNKNVKGEENGMFVLKKVRVRTHTL